MIVNGRQQQHIQIADRAFQYGDGCFTTIAFRNGGLEFFAAHIERLKLACEKLYINFNKWEELQLCIVDSLTSASDCVVKVMITRGEGGRGYNPEGAINPNYVISLHDIPAHYPLWQTDGIKLTISPIKLAKQPLLARIKHLNRLEQVLVKQSLAQTGYDDAVVCDTQQQIVESSIGNLFWYKNNSWYTANLTESGVEGVMRNRVLAFMQEKGIKCQVVKQDVSELFSVNELFVCNSLMLLVPVVSLFDPINKKHQDFEITQFKQLQHYIQLTIDIKALKI